MSLKSSCDKILEYLNLTAYGNLACRRLIRFSEFYYQLSVDGLANGSDAFGG